MSNLVLNLSLEMDPVFLGDILVTAFDGDYGGCWYWALPAESGWPVVMSGISDTAIWQEVHITLVDTEDDMLQFGDGVKKTEEYACITHEIIVRGAQKAIDEGFDGILEAIVEQDAGAIDSSMADVIVQFGLFGDIVYG